MNYDQKVSLAHGGDTGENNPESIQPIVKEKAWPGAAGRPDENNRVRTEILRRAAETTNFFIDYDRALILRADAPLTFAEPVSGNFTLALGAGGNLWVYPSLTPGRVSGGRDGGGKVYCENPSEAGAWTPYAGSLGTDELTLAADRTSTGQRGYADSDDYSVTAGGRSVGANRIEFNLVADSSVAGGLANITAVISGAPRVKITVTYGTLGSPTTLAHLITFINADRSSQGAFGVADFLKASTTGTTSNPPVPFTGGVVQGAYDAEAHQITQAQLAAFFAATVGGVNVNRLREGEGLAIGYPLGPVESGVTSPRGGRRQSVYDLPTDRNGTFTSNITPASGWTLFVTGREPEKIPGAIPIGKVLHGEFVFIDGTRLAPGETLTLGESRTMWLALASDGSSTTAGARLIGYEGGPSWNADALSSDDPEIATGTVHTAIQQIVADLADETGTNNGARRVGSGAIAGATRTGNEARKIALTQGSLREQLDDVLNKIDGGVIVGINGRVSESGHRLVGANPLLKDFGGDDMPAAGAVMIQGELQAPVNMMALTAAGVQEFQSLNLQPIVYTNAGDAEDVLPLDNAVGFSTSTSLVLSAMTVNQFTKVFAKLPVAQDATSGRTLPLLYVKLLGLSGCADAADGVYTVVSRNTASRVVVLKKLNGSDPNFTGLSGTPSLTFMSALTLGSDFRHSRVHGFVHTDLTNNTLGAPVVSFGLGTEDSRLMDVWIPNGNLGTIASTRYANRTEYLSPGHISGVIGVGGGPVFGGHVQRSTDNILRSADKQRLDGNETGTPIDATSSHIHGPTYNRYEYKAANNVSAALSGIATSAPGTSFATGVASGFTNVGATVYYDITIVPTGAGALSALFQFIEPSGRICHYMELSYTASGAGDVRHLRGQVTVPLTANAYAFVQSVLNSNVNNASSTYSFDVLSVFSVIN